MGQIIHFMVFTRFLIWHWKFGQRDTTYFRMTPGHFQTNKIMIWLNFFWFYCKLFNKNGIEEMTSSSMSHAGIVGAHTHSLGRTIKSILLTNNSHEINEFLAISGINYQFKSQIMVFCTCKNVGEIFETLTQRLHQNCRARQIGHVRVTFPIGRLEVKIIFTSNLIPFAWNF